MIERKTKTFWRATVALGIASVFIFANLYVPQPLLPLLATEFSVSPVTSSLLISTAMLTLGIFFFPYGALSDAVGRKSVILVAMVAATVLTFAIGFATSFEMLLLLRVLQAIALAGIPTIAMAYISEEYAWKALPLAIGIYISANSLGGMSGRLASGIFADYWGWRSSFLLMAAFSLLCILLVYFLLPSSKNFKPKAFKVGESLQSYRNHLKNRTLRLAFIVGGLHFFVFVGIYNYIGFFLSEEPFQVSTTVLGFIFITYLAGMISSTVAGQVSQTVKQSVCIGIGIGIMVIGMIFTLFPHLAAITIGLLFISFGFFFAHSCSSAWVSTYAFEAKASASGLYLTSYYFGGSIGSLYLGLFWATGGWHGVIGGAFVILAITTYVTFQMFKIEKDKQESHKNIS
ncbi:MFS transporter [Halalkalibacterium ligniniphilum]|uniref:MFS transporter n=1 Tax=Halalkalibacterium ligniniphilum TaxID=1134413 RepID=UPI00034757C9|nr:MFS transporter [Halalkalibacterium ligniniphilum]